MFSRYIFAKNILSDMIVTKIEKSFWVIGISYKNADFITRGKFSINTSKTMDLLYKAKSLKIENLLVLSTCNRTEIYGSVIDPGVLSKLLCEYTAGNEKILKNLGYFFKNKQAYNHLFKVGAGLDSQILGDFEIIGQIKKSFYLSKKANVKLNFLERLLNSVIQSSKRIKNETKISSGAASISYASVKYLLDNVSNISNKKILLFGSGKIGRNTCENLVKHTKNKNIFLINRTKEKAELIGSKLNIKVRQYKFLQEEIKSSDILIVATGSMKPTIEKQIIFNTKPIVILDLSIPNNVDLNVKDLKNVTLINIDELSQITDETLKKRKKYIPETLKIIEEIKGEFIEWESNRKFVPSIKAFKKRLLSENYNQNLTPEMIQKIIGKYATVIKENPKIANKSFIDQKNLLEIDLSNHE